LLGDEFRACLRELQAAVQARWEAEARLTDLYREREIARGSSSRARSERGAELGCSLPPVAWLM
jgi:hypothetical protein